MWEMETARIIRETVFEVPPASGFIDFEHDQIDCHSFQRLGPWVIKKWRHKVLILWHSIASIQGAWQTFSSADVRSWNCQTVQTKANATSVLFLTIGKCAIGITALGPRAFCVVLKQMLMLDCSDCCSSANIPTICSSEHFEHLKWAAKKRIIGRHGQELCCNEMKWFY